jgi:hypothetical protein
MSRPFFGFADRHLHAEGGAERQPSRGRDEEPPRDRRRAELPRRDEYVGRQRAYTSRRDEGDRRGEGRAWTPSSDEGSRDRGRTYEPRRREEPRRGDYQREQQRGRNFEDEMRQGRDNSAGSADRFRGDDRQSRYDFDPCQTVPREGRQGQNQQFEALYQAAQAQPCDPQRHHGRGLQA